MTSNWMKQLSKRKKKLLAQTPTFEVKFPKYSFPDDKKELPKVLETMKNKPIDKKLIKDLDKNNLKMMLDVVGEKKSNYKDFINDVDIYTMKLKMKYGRKRPYEISKIKSVTDTDDTPSFPSGHATEAHALEKILSSKYPDKAKELKSMADKISLSRVQMGNHFPSDIIVGKKVGYKIAEEYLKINKNIQISSQKGKQKDIILPPEEDDERCCEILSEIIERATDYDATYGQGMIGVPTFLDTGGYVPDDYFMDELTDDLAEQDWMTSKSVVLEIAVELNEKFGEDWREEFKRLNKLYTETLDYLLNAKDTCEKIITSLDKWSDRDFVGWQFYEEWVYTYTSGLDKGQIKGRVERDYNEYMDSYKRVHLALLREGCDDLLIQKPWMKKFVKSWEGIINAK